MENQNELMEWVEKHKFVKPWLFLTCIYDPHTKFPYRLRGILRKYIGEDIIAEFFAIRDRHTCCKVNKP